jgi:hypothetical protein
VDAVSAAEKMSDTELLAAALQDAMDAHRRGLIIGPAVDSVALARAERRALHQDTQRVLRTVAADRAVAS